MVSSGRRHLLAWMFSAAFCAMGFVSSTQVKGEIVSAESQGYGIQVDAEVAGILDVDLLTLTPDQLSSGVAPPAYSVSANSISVAADVGTSIGPIAGTTVELNLLASDGLVNSSASSDVDGGSGFRTTQGFGEVNGLDLGIANAVVTDPVAGTIEVPFFNLTADTISSTSVIDGDYGALAATGNSIIQNLGISVAGVDLDIASLLGVDGSIDADGFITVDPNTEILDVGGIAGLNLTFNEQITSGDGIADLALQTTALKVTFNGVDLGLPLINGALNGEASIGYSFASMSAVPEPASCGMVLLGAIAVATVRRRRVHR